MHRCSTSHDGRKSPDAVHAVFRHNLHIPQIIQFGSDMPCEDIFGLRPLPFPEFMIAGICPQRKQLIKVRQMIGWITELKRGNKFDQMISGFHIGSPGCPGSPL